MRRFNWIFFLVLVTAVAVTGGGAYLLHSRQVQSQAHGLLDYAREAESSGNLDLASEHLRRFLQFEREEPEAWSLYARVVDRRDAKGNNPRQTLRVLDQALRYIPDDEEIRQRAADLALEVGDFETALRHLEALYKAIDPDREEQVARAAELEALLGRCEQGLARFDKAETWYRRALDHDPSAVEAGARLARLLRDRLDRPIDADVVIERLVEDNPESALARLRRWQYREAFGLESDPDDIAFALKSEPDHGEILLAAAALAQRREDRDEARALLSRGIEHNPEQGPIYLAAATLELIDGQPEQAIAIFNQGIEALPENLDLRFFLVDTLIGLESGTEPEDTPDGGSDSDLDARIADLKKRGIAEGLVRYLEARVLFNRGQWSRAVPRINTARQLLAGSDDLVGRLDLMLAECHGKLGSDELQLAALRQAAERDSTSRVARLELASRLERDGNPEAALSIHRLLMQDRPESQIDLARLMIQQTLRQPAAERNWNAAERQLAEAERNLPRAKTDTDLLRVDLLMARNHPDDALKVLEALQERDPDDLRVPIALARIADRQGDSDRASQLLDRAEQGRGRTLEIDLERIASLTRRGDDEARTALTRMAEQADERPAEERAVLFEALAVAHLQLGDLERSRDLWKRLEDLEPDNIRIRMVLIDLALAAEEPTEVGDHVNRMRQIEGPNGLLWRYAEAVLQLHLADRGVPNALRLAQDRARQINQISADWWGSHAINAQIAEREGQLDAAAQHYLQAVERGANQPTLARRLVGLLYQQQQFDTIDRVVRLLEQRNAGLADLTLIEALNALRRGEVDRGLTLARRLLPADSENAADHLFIGRMMVYSGRFDAAEPVLRRAVELGPADPTAWLSLAECLLRLGQLDQARELRDQAVEAVEAEQRTLLSARFYDLLGDLDQARSSYESALRQRPDDLGTLRGAIEFAVRTGDSKWASTLLERVRDPRFRATESDLAWANRMRSTMLLASGDLEQVDAALDLVRSNLEENPYSFDDQKMRAILLSMRPSRRQEAIEALTALDRNRALEPSEQFLLAMLHGAGGEWDACRALLTRIVDNPVSLKDPRPLIYFVAFLIDRGDLAEAARRLDQLRPLLPEGMQLLAFEARLLREGKQDDEALSLLRTYRESHPDQVGPLASLYDQLGYKDEAEQAYRDFAAQDPEQPELVVPLISFLGQQGKTAEALELLRSAESQLPPEAVAVAGVGVLFSAPERTAEHVDQVERQLLATLKNEPDSVVLLIQLAVLRTFQERFDEAEARYREALSHEPENLQVLNNLAWLLGFRRPERNEGPELIDRAIELAGPAPALLDTRAVLRVRKGQVDPALADLRLALANAPEVPELYLHLAQAHHRAGNLDEAREALRTAEELGLTAARVDPLERDDYARLRSDLMP